jgi:pimeloyl-ACP methyl ester carboxylesterase
MKLIRPVAMLLLMVFFMNISTAQRFREPVFDALDSINAIAYGSAMNIKGNAETLLMDLIFPQGDTMKKRPLVVFIHGGGFQNNSRKGSYSAMVCQGFAKRGYATATIDYRLGIENQKTEADYANALYRAQQDGRAAIRFLKKHAAQYGIDTNQVFLTGSSAGSKTALAIAYMDEAELPAGINIEKWGPLEGKGGSEGYSSKVHGVMNAWGAMIDFKWIKQGDAPLFNTSGTMDKTVAFDSSFGYHGFNYGGYILYQHCLALGIPTAWRPFYGAGHTLDNDKTKQDSCFQSMVEWLYPLLAINPSKITKLAIDNHFQNLQDENLWRSLSISLLHRRAAYW